MKNRKAIGVVLGLIVGICATILVMNATVLTERQQYAVNAYNLGKAEYLGVSVMSPEEAAQFQERIQEIMNSELTLEQQEEKIEEVFKVLQEYIAGEGETSGGL